VPNLLTEMNKVQSFRTNGASILVSNTSPMIEIQGNIGGAVSPRSKHWTQWAEYTSGNNMLTPIVVSPDKMVGKASRGIYGFIKPRSEESFEYKTYWTCGKLGVLDSRYPLEEEEDYLVVIAVVLQAEGRSFLVTLDSQIEFPTDNQWKETKVPMASREVIDSAMKCLRKVPTWHENPTHLKDIAAKIGNVLKNIISGVVKYGPTALSVAKTIDSIIPP
jgi:hypothetical protein